MKSKIIITSTPKGFSNFYLDYFEIFENQKRIEKLEEILKIINKKNING